MNKFENIKVGDIVFTERCVNYSWNSTKTFYIPEKVIRVTKTQFTVECGDRYKKEGHKIGDSDTAAYFEGDDRCSFSGAIPVCDDTEKMEAFKLKLKAEKELNSVAEKIKIGSNSQFTVNELKELIDKLAEVHNIIKAKQHENRRG